MTKLTTVLNKLDEISLWKKVGVLIGFILVIWALYGMLFLRPRYSEWMTLQKRLDKLTKEVATYTRRAKELKVLENKIKSKKIEFAYAKALLPESTEEVEKLLSDIEKIGREIGIEFLLFVPANEEKHEFYAKKYIKLNLLGSFHNLLRFYNELFKLDRLVTLEDISLSPKRELKDIVILKATSKIAIYRVLKESEIKKLKKKRKRRGRR